MTLSFTLTNISILKNTFQFKGVDAEFTSLFQLEFNPPGELSPGISTHLTLKFTPRYNAPVKCFLHFITKTSPFQVQIECNPKKVQIQIEPVSSIDLGTITLGEDASGTIILRNSGALVASFTLFLEDESLDDVLKFSLKRGTINGYSAQKIKVDFHPNSSCYLNLGLTFKFNSPDRLF
jgi:hypothetical protein